jgi:hypothetical protein
MTQSSHSSLNAAALKDRQSPFFPGFFLFQSINNNNSMPRGQNRAAAIKALEKSQQQAFDDDEESEWEQEDEHQSQSSSDNYKQDSVVDDKHDTKPPAKKKKNKQRKPTLMDSQDYNVSSSSSNDDESQHHRDDENDDDLLPSYARKTAKGGYAHTWKSRARISKANKGNTPWNKGKNRSEGVKAKIAAGVRARNRKVLLEKLKKLNMTEEEWLAKKKEIKYLRERIRKAKKAAEAREAQKLRKGKDADKSYEELEKELSAKLQAKVQSMQWQGDMTKTTTPSNSKPKNDADRSSKEEMLEKIFTPHVAWTRHDYDDMHDGLYEQ